MKSIRTTLTRRLSITISLVVVVVLLAADIAVDSWVENEFNRAIKEKVVLLRALIDVDQEGVTLNLADEHLPEFEGSLDPEYVQLWAGKRVVARSETLSLYETTNLPYQSISQNEIRLVDAVLPDGRSGRIAYIQLASSPRRKTANEPILLAYATATEQLNYYLWFIDIAFVLALIFIPLIIRFTVQRTVSYALKPLEQLNQQVRDIRFSEQRQKLTLAEPIEELSPIADGLNHFIEENYSLYLREKRLTSDIAHELKTPVTELINLAEITIKYPGDSSVEANFKQDVLKAGLRMKSIISGLLVLHKYSHQPLELTDSIDLEELLTRLIKHKSTQRLQLQVQPAVSSLLLSNTFAIESIINNLIANAITYSPGDSQVLLTLEKPRPERLLLRISNEIIQPIQEHEIPLMFDPMWQKDMARSSSENFGLGLSIVKILSQAIRAELEVSSTDNRLTFTMSFPCEPNR